MAGEAAHGAVRATLPGVVIAFVAAVCAHLAGSGQALSALLGEGSSLTAELVGAVKAELPDTFDALLFEKLVCLCVAQQQANAAGEHHHLSTVVTERLH